MSSRRHVRVPASTANLGAGFDALSLAIAVYLDVEVVPDAGPGQTRFAAAGVDADKIPSGADNLVVRVMHRVAERRRRSLPGALLRAWNQIPIARGMGSSAAAIVAGVSCYEILADETLTEDELFDCAFEFEPHPDNLAAALRGGLAVSAARPDGPTLVSTFGVAEGVHPVLVVPEFELSTERAREVLPDTYSRADVVFNVQRAALSVGALTTGRWDLLAEAMKDRMHQPYRASLIPGLEQVLALRADGLIAAALSGAGPTVLALAREDCADAIGRRIAGVFEQNGVRSSVHVCAIDTTGRVFH